MNERRRDFPGSPLVKALPMQRVQVQFLVRELRFCTLCGAVKKKKRRWKVTKMQTLFSRNSRSSKDKELHPHSTYMRICYPKGGICQGSSQVDLNQDVKNSQVGTDRSGWEEDKSIPRRGDSVRRGMEAGAPQDVSAYLLGRSKVCCA